MAPFNYSNLVGSKAKCMTFRIMTFYYCHISAVIRKKYIELQITYRNHMGQLKEHKSIKYLSKF